jgi:RND family efflux transporter MFP subunit
VRAGQEVSKGAALLVLVPNPQTSVAYAQAVSALQNAKDLAAHTQDLLKLSLATKQDLANAQKAQSDAEAALAALKTQGAAGPTTLRAPLRAIVTKLSVAAGAAVDVGTPLLELAPPTDLVLHVGVVPSQATTIASGSGATVTPIGGAQSYSGKVVSRGSIVEPETGLVPVDISVPAGAVLPGQTAEAAITTGNIQGYIVPHEAILVDDAGQPYVVQVINMKAKIVHVRILAADGDKNTIDGQLQADAPIVLAGNYQLQDGMRVRLTDPAKGN